MFLVKFGVPWDVAMDLEPYEVLGFCVIFGQIEGNTFDWTQMQWQKPRD